MPSQLLLERVLQDVSVLSCAGLDVESFLAEVHESLGRAVPSDAACVATVDPATGLATGAFKFGDLRDRSDTDELWASLEYGAAEPTSFVELARRGVAAVGVVDATGTASDRSPRHRDLVRSALGCTDELRVVAVAGRRLWGGVALFRSPPFDAAEIAFAGRLSELLGRGIRSGLLAGIAGTGSVPPEAGPAVLVFDRSERLVQASSAAQQRLAELGGGTGEPGPVIGALVAAGWRHARSETTVPPSSRVRTRSGEWLLLHAAPLRGVEASATSVVVTIEEARPPEIVPIVVAAFGLTPREREVTQLVLQGADTRRISQVLAMSPYTVQDHLRAVFDKTGVGSRRELVSKVFFDQYAPRIGSPVSGSGWFADEPGG